MCKLFLILYPVTFFSYFPFSSPRMENVLQHTFKAQVNSTAAKSYIIFWVYGFLISRYSSWDDVTDMDSEHISNRFLEDIQYGCQETFNQIIKIDNLIYLKLYCEISKSLLGVIRGWIATINDPFERRKNWNKVFFLFNGMFPLRTFCIPSWIGIWAYSHNKTDRK